MVVKALLQSEHSKEQQLQIAFGWAAASDQPPEQADAAAGGGGGGEGSAEDGGAAAAGGGGPARSLGRAKIMALPLPAELQKLLAPYSAADE